MPDIDSLGGPDTHIPALDGDAGDTGNDAAEVEIPALADEPAAEEETAPEPAAEADQGAETDPSEQAVADDDPLLAQFAKRTGLNPKDPAQRKTLETIVNKEKYIQQLKAERAAPQQEGQPQPLTKFEEEAAKAAEEAAKAETKQDAPQAPVVGQYRDVGEKWSSPVDGYNALAAAWQHAQETGDLSQVVQTEAALYERRFDAIGLPKVEALVNARFEQLLKDRFGDIMPTLQEQAHAARREEAQEFAFSELEKVPTYKEIRSLTQEQQGQPLVVNGEQYPNTPLNKIIAENPWILHIKREAADPRTADRLTYLARLKAAHSIHSRGRVSAETAKALVNAGSQQEQRKAQDQVRQSLNKGGTPSKTLDKGAAKPKSYIEELLTTGEGPVSFSDL